MPELNNINPEIRIPNVNRIDESESINFFIALDGSQHPTLASVEKANEEYWKMLIPKTSEFSTIEKDPILLPSDIQIMYYKNVLDYLKRNKLDYNEWEKYYHFFKNRLDMNDMTPEFALLFATFILKTTVIRKTSVEEARYQEQTAILLGIIADLNNNQNQTRN